MADEIGRKYYAIKSALKSLLDDRLRGRERLGNGYAWGMLFHVNGDDLTMHTVNAGRYIYEMSATDLDDLLDDIQRVLDSHLLQGGKNESWFMGYVMGQIQRGVGDAHRQLARQSARYDNSVTLAERLSSPEVQNQIAQMRLSTFSDWTEISDTARADLSRVLVDAVARGVNPRETAKVISQRLDVSESKARTVAQTEQLGALRKAHSAESDWARDELGINNKLLWLSALKPVTRWWHAARHGQLYTSQEIDAFYAEGGNKFNCYCSQIPALVDDDGNLLNPGLADKMTAERERWGAANGKKGKPGGSTPPQAPKAAPPTPAPAPKPKPAPKAPATPEVTGYQPPEWKPQLTLSKLSAYASGRIAETVKLPAGTPVGVANNALQLLDELNDRFDLRQLRYFGSARSDPNGTRYRISKNMIAGYAERANAMLVTPKAFDPENEAKCGDISRGLQRWDNSRVKLANGNYGEAVKAAHAATEAITWHAVPTIRGVWAHETGHAVHAKNDALLTPITRKAFAEGWHLALSGYAETNPDEYLAEAFSLYVNNPDAARKRIYPPLFAAFTQLDKAK